MWVRKWGFHFLATPCRKGTIKRSPFFRKRSVIKFLQFFGPQLSHSKRVRRVSSYPLEFQGNSAVQFPFLVWHVHATNRPFQAERSICFVKSLYSKNELKTKTLAARCLQKAVSVGQKNEYEDSRKTNRELCLVFPGIEEPWSYCNVETATRKK